MLRQKRLTFFFVLMLALVGSATQVLAQEPYAPDIDPANFVDKVDNPYFPLTPGTTMVYMGETDEGTERIEVTVLPETREVMGIVATVVRDTVWLDGVLVEDTFDWFAQDIDGNVWYMGEASRDFEEGVITSTEGSWEAGVDGALPGIVMEGSPQVGDSYRQEYYVGVAEDMAEVISLSESAAVAYGAFDSLLVTNEWNPLEPGTAEHKYYAEGVGLVLEEVVEGGTGRVELVEVITRDIMGDEDEGDDEDESGDVDEGGDDAEADEDDDDEGDEDDEDESGDVDEGDDEDDDEGDEDDEDGDDVQAPSGTPIISEEQAIAAAEAQLAGAAVREVELEYEHGRWVYSVESSSDEVTVDAITGEVLSTEADDD